MPRHHEYDGLASARRFRRPEAMAKSLAHQAGARHAMPFMPTASQVMAELCLSDYQDALARHRLALDAALAIRDELQTAKRVAA